MALQTINLGNFANDGTGDDLRTAFSKVNANFEELDLQGGQANTISNVGVGTGLYKEKIGVDLRLKTLLAGNGITITASSNEVTITNNRNSILKVNGNTGSFTSNNPNGEINIVGGSGVSTSVNGNTLTITGNNYTLNTDPNPTLGGNLNLNGFGIQGIGSSIVVSTLIGNLTGNTTGLHTGNVNGDLTGNVFGTVYGHINGIDPVDLVNTFDFGPINKQTQSPIQYLLLSTMIDLGTFSSPAEVGIEGGTFI